MRTAVSRLLCAAAIAVALAASCPAAAGQPEPPAPIPLLVVLRETGGIQNGLPVYERHPEAARYEAVLTKGMSGRLLRLYALEQHYLQARKGTRPEPAYLLASGNMGGFPRFGFVLGTVEKRDAGYVDLQASRRLAGFFGADDQIFPHELAHIILVQLAGPPGGGGANQIHAIGVRTDRINAFHEGFAEHLQVLAVDAPDCVPETRRLREDSHFAARTARQVREYRRDLEAYWPVPGRRRIAFPFWFSGAEQGLRYHAVKANAFARQPKIPAGLLTGDLFNAYLIENALPGDPDGELRTPSQLLSTEGVISALFVRWVTEPSIQSSRGTAEMYDAFGTTPEQVTPIENAYLKMFHAFFLRRPRDAQQAIAGYKASFPQDAAAIDRLVSAVSLGQSFEAPAPIWLANDSFVVGTSLFDQFRGLPRTHTFDLNAASLVDLLAVPGVDLRLAAEIRRAAPYASMGELVRARGITADMVDRFRRMERRASELAANAAAEESSLRLSALLRPYAWRAGLLLLVTGIVGGFAYRLAVPAGWARATANGLAAVVIGFLAEIALELPRGAAGILAPLLLFGLPGALWCLAFPRRLARRAGRRVGASPNAPEGSATHAGLRFALAGRVLFGWLLAPAALVLLLIPYF